MTTGITVYLVHDAIESKILRAHLHDPIYYCCCYCCCCCNGLYQVHGTAEGRAFLCLVLLCILPVETSQALGGVLLEPTAPVFYIWSRLELQSLGAAVPTVLRFAPWNIGLYTPFVHHLFVHYPCRLFDRSIMFYASICLALSMFVAFGLLQLEQNLQWLAVGLLYWVQRPIVVCGYIFHRWNFAPPEREGQTLQHWLDLIDLLL